MSCLMAVRSLDSLPTQPLPQPSTLHRRSAAGEGDGATTSGGDGATAAGGGGADSATIDGESMKDVLPCSHHNIYPYTTRYWFD